MGHTQHVGEYLRYRSSSAELGPLQPCYIDQIVHKTI
jgi:hypothetical protein